MSKKKWIVIILFVLAVTTFCACVSKMESEQLSDASMFSVVEQGSGYKVVYHKDTKVMYVISGGDYNRGNFTVMLNPDGTPMVWSGRGENQ